MNSKQNVSSVTSTPLTDHTSLNSPSNINASWSDIVIDGNESKEGKNSQKGKRLGNERVEQEVDSLERSDCTQDSKCTSTTSSSRRKRAQAYANRLNPPTFFAVSPEQVAASVKRSVPEGEKVTQSLEHTDIDILTQQLQTNLTLDQIRQPSNITNNQNNISVHHHPVPRSIELSESSLPLDSNWSDFHHANAYHNNPHHHTTQNSNTMQNEWGMWLPQHTSDAFTPFTPPNEHNLLFHATSLPTPSLTSPLGNYNHTLHENHAPLHDTMHHTNVHRHHHSIHETNMNSNPHTFHSQSLRNQNLLVGAIFESSPRHVSLNSSTHQSTSLLQNQTGLPTFFLDVDPNGITSHHQPTTPTLKSEQQQQQPSLFNIFDTNTNTTNDIFHLSPSHNNLTQHTSNFSNFNSNNNNNNNLYDMKSTTSTTSSYKHTYHPNSNTNNNNNNNSNNVTNMMSTSATSSVLAAAINSQEFRPANQEIFTPFTPAFPHRKVICDFFLRAGLDELSAPCTKGDRCQFLHPSCVAPNGKTTHRICPEYFMGYCATGETCTKLHPIGRFSDNILMRFRIVE